MESRHSSALNLEIEGIEEKSLKRLLEYLKNVESFIKVQMRSGNERRRYSSFCKIKIMIARPKIWCETTTRLPLPAITYIFNSMRYNFHYIYLRRIPLLNQECHHKKN